jgi:hypothetical protein
MPKLRPYTNVHYIKSPHFSYTNTQTCQHHMLVSTISNTTHLLYQTCQNCGHYNFPNPISITTLLLCKHVKIADLCKCPPYQSLHFFYTNMSKLRTYANVHYINHYTFSMQTCQNCGPMQMSTISTFAMQTCQNCVPMQMSTISNHYTLLCKHVKIADTTIFLNQVSTISNTTHLLYQTCQNCVHIMNVHYIK